MMRGNFIVLSVVLALLERCTSKNIPTGYAQGLYAMEATDIDGNPYKLEQHNGQVALVVNLASH